ncbi:MAG: sigma-54 dependent transcriptional regulator [Candidatus Electryonea clarkiae]|nr:sigma-54 dependent transcriptional regulator [Candidatus Electryonea clarkiae]MDP8287038.1 sigma-54 dependent transcriptional regulator [Candidatus Electryonea clarkiae]
MRILHVDDDEQSRRVVSQVIEGLLGHQVTTCEDARQALKLYYQYTFPLVISDIRMPGKSGMDLLHEIKNSPSGRNTDVVLITGFADLDSAIAALREGAIDYLRKPLKAEELIEVVNRIVTQRSIEETDLEPRLGKNDSPLKTAVSNLKLNEPVISFPDGSRLGLFSSAMRSLADIALRFHEDRTVPVLIEGETGTGKEMFARLIHYGSSGSNLPFVIVNCAAIASTLFESELFGYAGGAFTGAKPSGSPGKFEAAEGGTIFFDEVGEIPLSLQPKLLRVLQEKAIYRVGSSQKIPLDFRVITATNRDLEKMIKEGSFREDLYYRLHVGHIEVPSLRKQQSAIPPLARMFLTLYTEKMDRCFRSIHQDAVRLLESYPWHGNIRELDNVIRNAVLLYDGSQLLPEHLDILYKKSDQTLSKQTVLTYPFTIQLPENGFSLEELNNAIIRKAFEMHDGNQTRTAEYLKMSRYALRSRLKKLD